MLKSEGVRRPLVAVIVLAMAIAAVLVLTASPASAATFTESHTDSIGATDTDWFTPPAPPDPLTFPQFDPIQGTLTEVTIEYDSELTGEMGAENFSSSSTCTVILDWGADVSLDTLDGVLLSELDQIENASLDVFNGTIDFTGPSGATGTVVGGVGPEPTTSL